VQRKSAPHSVIFANAGIQGNGLRTPTFRQPSYGKFFAVIGLIANGIGVARQDLDRGGASADHGAQVWTAPVLRTIGVIYAVVERPFDWLKGDLPRRSGRDDPPRLLPYRRLGHRSV